MMNGRTRKLKNVPRLTLAGTRSLKVAFTTVSGAREVSIVDSESFMESSMIWLQQATLLNIG